MYKYITNLIYNGLIEIIWQLCSFYNIIRIFFIKFFPPKPPNRIEPPENKEWYLLCYIDTDGLSLIEKYYDTFDEVNSAYSIISVENENILFLHNYGTNEESEKETVTLVKKGKPVNTPNPPEKSQKRIIYAEYNHSEMNYPVYFPNMERYSLVGNELFTPEFILRYLEYNCLGGCYKFDKQNYTMVIMDNDMNVYNGLVRL